jgi:DNA-binding winged helix-turn-helix (wHTH) protein
MDRPGPSVVPAGAHERPGGAIVRFEGFELSADGYQLVHDGRPIALEPMAFDLLLHLLENRHRVVSREELMAKIWCGAARSGGVLSQCVAVLRKALGDDGAAQRIVRTLHGRGYRFVADVEHVAAVAKSQAVDLPSEVRRVVRGAARVPGLRRAPSALDDRFLAWGAGAGRIALVDGEPGIGKTWLAQQLRARAEEEGWAVAAGRCVASQCAPLWPWREILRAAGCEPVELEDVRAVEQSLESLAEVARTRPLLVELEDLHAADAATLFAFQVWTRYCSEIPTLLVATFRSTEVGDALDAALNGISSDLDVTRVTLEALEDAEIRAIAEEVLGHAVRDDDVSRLRRHTGGNPLFITETCRALARSGGPLDGSLPVSRRVEDLVRRRISALSLDARAVLSSVADGTAGAAWPSGSGERTTLATDELLRAGLLERTVQGALELRYEMIRELALRGASRASSIPPTKNS